MDETRQLVDALKRCLKARGVTYHALAQRINLSEASVKRIFAQRTFTLKRVEQVCQALGISVVELIRMIDRGGGEATVLSVDQESALAKDPALFSYFCLLLNGMTETQIHRDFEFQATQAAQFRLQLLALHLVEELPKRRHSLRVNRRIAWRQDGPVRQAYEAQVQREFLRSPFLGPQDFLGWQPAELTRGSMDVLRRKLAHLYGEFLDMAELDGRSTQPRYSSAILVAFRPWVFSLVAARRRGPQGRR